jgi:hypothetical protein
MPRRSALCLCLLAFSAGPARADDAAEVAADEQLLRGAGLAVDGPGLLRFFSRNTPGPDLLDRARALIKRLGDDDFAEREKASEALAALGAPAVPLLREAARSADVEVARRAAAVLEKVERQTNPALPGAAVRLLGHRRPEGAVAALLAFAPAAQDATLLDDVAAALARAGVREGKADPLLVKALADAAPARRAVAAEALARGKAADQRDAVRKLLADTDSTVRERVALALLGARDKEAVPALINLLGELPRDRRYAVEDALYRVAGDKAPPADGDARKQQEAWRAWWKAEADKLDLAKLDLGGRAAGLTVLTQYMGSVTQGRVTAVDAAGTVRWQIPDLRYAVDVQVLGPDRVLVTEYSGRTVSERDSTGKVLWQTATNGLPIGARRLPNGNTFIVMRNRLSEVNRDGQEVLGIDQPQLIQAATRLRDGRIGVVTTGGQFRLLDAKGQEVKSFPLGGALLAIGGNVEVLPNGHVLAPLYSSNKVVELNADGKQVWEHAFQLPTSVMRLANGNTLIAGRQSGLVVEVDRSGKEVWRYQCEGRPIRVTRR